MLHFANPPTNTFLNGDPIEWFQPGGKPKGPVHNTDFKVAPCSGPLGGIERNQSAVTSTFAEPNLVGEKGPEITPSARGVIACRKDAGDETAYRIASVPWRGHFWASAAAFVRDQPGRLAFDVNLPSCST